MTIESTTMRKLGAHVVPMLAVGAVLQAFSQLNVAFAGLEMTRALGFSNAQFGFGSGIFFLSYLVLGIPANALLLRVGARLWIALAMLAWGLLSAALAFISTPGQFYVLRLLVGAAEAGFIPGILYIAGAWFPEAWRGRVLSLLMVCNPIAAMIGGPASGALLRMGGFMGLAGWQWVFLAGGLAAVLLAPVALQLLPHSPERAAWLSGEEKAWLAARLASEHAVAPAPGGFTLRALVDTRVVALALVFLGVSALPFGLIFFLPKIIEAFGVSAAAASMLSATPFATGAVLMLLWGRSSDRRGERLYHALAGLLLALAGCVLYLVASGPVPALAGLCLTFGGTFAFLPIFWTLPSRLLNGPVAATGIAVINGMGGVSGIVAPTLMGVLRDATGHYEPGLACVMLTAIASGLLLWVYGRRHGLDRRRPWLALRVRRPHHQRIGERVVWRWAGRYRLLDRVGPVGIVVRGRTDIGRDRAACRCRSSTGRRPRHRRSCMMVRNQCRCRIFHSPRWRMKSTA
ncbi:MAG: MFS transporter [Candidatus Binatia bacterium]